MGFEMGKQSMAWVKHKLRITLGTRGFLKEEPRKGDKRSGEERENREDVRRPLVTRDSWLILPRQ